MMQALEARNDIQIPLRMTDDFTERLREADAAIPTSHSDVTGDAEMMDHLHEMVLGNPVAIWAIVVGPSGCTARRIRTRSV